LKDSDFEISQVVSNPNSLKEGSNDPPKKSKLKNIKGALFGNKKGSLKVPLEEKKKKKEKNAARKERKATKTLAIVLGKVEFMLFFYSNFSYCLIASLFLAH